MTEKTIFRLRALCFCDQEAQRYPLSLTCTDEALITDSARLMRRMKELEGRLNDRLRCCQVQELPFNQLYSADTSVDEQFYIASSPVELYRYFEHLSDRAEVSRIAGWRYRRGDLVEVVSENQLTLGIVANTPHTVGLIVLSSPSGAIEASTRRGATGMADFTIIDIRSC